MAPGIIHINGVKLASREIALGKAFSRIPLLPSRIMLPIITEVSARDYCGIAGRKRAKGGIPSAMKNYGKALFLDPGHEGANMGLGELHFLKKEFYKAAKCFEKAAERNPENADAAKKARRSRDELSMQQAMMGLY